MAKSDVERTTYGAFERFLYFFLIPMIYSSILVLVLFALFNSEVRDSILRTANSIPIIKEIVPDPKVVDNDSLLESPDLVQARKEAQDLINSKDAEMKTVIETSRKKDMTIEELQGQLADLREQLDEKQLSDEEYKQRIHSLASLYSSMNASKAAPILENLLPHELVLILGEMTSDQRVKVLEKMNPRTAADATMALKDLYPTKDQAILALQQRVEELEKKLQDRPDKLTIDELSATFAAMSPASASTVLLEMMATNESKVVAILQSMSNQGRSSILSEMTAKDKSAAAQISAKLNG